MAKQSSLIVRAQALSERWCGVSQKVVAANYDISVKTLRRWEQQETTWAWAWTVDRWLIKGLRCLNIIECCRYHLGDWAVAGGGVMGQGSWGSSDERSPRTTESPACNWRDSTPRQLASSQEEQSTIFFMKIWGTQVGNQWWHGSHYSPKRRMQRGNSRLVRGGTRARSGPSICSVIRR